MAAIESHFHALIRHVVTSVGRAALPAALPNVEQALSRSGSMWYPVPGMYGGFSWTVHLEPEGPVLVAESWSRVVAGSGQRHRVTRDGWVLESSGFI